MVTDTGRKLPGLPAPAVPPLLALPAACSSGEEVPAALPMFALSGRRLRRNRAVRARSGLAWSAHRGASSLRS